MSNTSSPSSLHPGFQHIYGFEAEFDQFAARRWATLHGPGLCVTAGVLYLGLVFWGSKWMEKRPAYNLRGSLAAWSACLAIFSLAGFLRTGPELWSTLATGGLQESVCNPSFLETNKVSAFWTWLFTLSKLPELGDTVFIVLRKQNLIFLHWYHHLTVLIAVFVNFSEFNSLARWVCVINYFVHSIMYSYFALKAMKVKVPRVVNMLITSLQLLQFIVDMVAYCLAFHYMSKGAKCNITWPNLVFSSLLCSSYFVLFARFFFKAYLTRKEEIFQKRKDL